MFNIESILTTRLSVESKQIEADHAVNSSGELNEIKLGKQQEEIFCTGRDRNCFINLPKKRESPIDF